MADASNQFPSALQARLELRYAELCALEDQARDEFDQGLITKAELDEIYFTRKNWKRQVHKARARAIRDLAPEEIAERREIVERDRELVRELTRAANARMAAVTKTKVRS